MIHSDGHADKRRHGLVQRVISPFSFRHQQIACLLRLCTQPSLLRIRLFRRVISISRVVKRKRSRARGGEGEKRARCCPASCLVRPRSAAGLGLATCQDRVRERRASSCGRLSQLTPTAEAPRRSRSLAARDLNRAARARGARVWPAQPAYLYNLGRGC